MMTIRESALYVAQQLVEVEEDQGAVWPLWLGLAMSAIAAAVLFILSLVSDEESGRQEISLMAAAGMLAPFVIILYPLLMHYL